MTTRPKLVDDDADQPFRIFVSDDLVPSGPRRPAAVPSSISEPTKRPPPEIRFRVVDRRKSEPTYDGAVSAIFDPSLVAPSVANTIAATRFEAIVSNETEQELIAILTSNAPSGETIEVQYTRKEHALGTAFAGLHSVECRALHKRLSNPRPGDVLATHFARLVAPRRERLLAFLLDARRREATASARR